MANKHILKKSRRQAAVLVTGTGTATIDIFELASADQVVTEANVELTISDLAYDVANSANVKRSGNLIFAMNAGQNEFNFTDNLGVVLNEKSNSNVIVNLGASEGTVIIQFTKGSGYNDPDRQHQGPGSL